MDSVDFLAGTQLFQGIGRDDIRALLGGCLDAREREYGAGAYVLRMGDVTRSLGLVLSGRVRIENVDAWGTVSVVGFVDAGDIFAEVYAVIPDEQLMVNVVAAEPTRVLFLDAGKILSACTRSCARHGRLARNLNLIIARKNLVLTRRILHSAPKSIRGKLLAYLSYVAAQQGSDEFDIPFNRQQLADYLGVDRSALSAELSRMQGDGLLKTRRSHFVLGDLDRPV